MATAEPRDGQRSFATRASGAIVAARVAADVSEGTEDAMDGRVRWLRIGYSASAVIDVLAAIQMLSPRVFAATKRLTGFHPPWEYRCAPL